MSSNKESIVKKKGKFRWKVVFGFLLFVNLIYFGFGAVGALAGGNILYEYRNPVFITYAIIDFVAVLSYIITRQPHGIAKIISYTVLVALGLVLLSSANYILQCRPISLDYFYMCSQAMQ